MSAVKSTNTQKEENQLIKIFDWLRFPLILGVIFIHNYSFKSISCVSDNYTSVGMIEFFSNELGRLAVPLFFLISGYLFDYKIDIYNPKVYIYKIRRRVKSLLIPYLFWNLLILCVYFVMYMGKGDNPVVHSNANIFGLIKDTFIGIPKDGKAYPLVYQLWFIRDLFCVALISPLVNWLLVKAKSIYIFTLSILWVFDIWWDVLECYCLSISALFFFSLGAFISFYNIKLIKIVKNIRVLGCLYLPLAIIDIIFNWPVLHNVAILVGIILCLTICIYFEESNKLKPIPFLASSSFFIFVIHEPFLLSITRKLTTMVMPENVVFAMIGYFLSVIVTVFVALLLYKCLCKLFPKTMSIICGGH